MCYCGMMQPILTEAICVSSGRASRSPSSSQLRGTSLPRRQGYCLGTMETFFSSSFPVGSATGKQRNPDMKSSLVCGERARKESHGSIVFALLRIIFSLQFPLLIANFSSFSKSRSTSALPPSPTRAGASRNCHRWAKEKHTCLFLIYLESSFSWCYWAGQLPGSSGHVAGVSALRTGPVEENSVPVQAAILFPRDRLPGSSVTL